MSLLDTASLIVTPNGYKEGKLYSVIPSDGSGDLSVTRATTATRVNSQGLVELVPYNLLQYSEQIDNGYWLKYQSIITANATTAPNGTLTADRLTQNGAGAGTFYVTPSAFNGGLVSLSCFYKKGIGNIGWLEINRGAESCYIQFNLDTQVISASGNYASTNIESVGNGWFRCSVVSNQSAGTANYIGFGNIGNNGDTIFAWGAQLNEGTIKPYQKTETRLNIPRLDYSNGTCPSILVEPQRTNLLTYSENLTLWNQTNQIASRQLVANQLTGVNNATKITRASVGTDPYVGQIVSAGNGTYTFSVYLWTDAGQPTDTTLFMYNSAVSEVYTLDVTLTTTPTRYEFDATFANTGGTITARIDLINSTDQYIYAYGAQLEAGSYATSYIPTTSASVTRNADVISKTGISSLIGQTEGTIFIDAYRTQKSVNYQALIGLGNGTSSSQMMEFFYRSSNELTIGVYNSGQQFVNNTVIANGRHKIALAYKANDFALYIDGVLIATDNSGTVPTMNQLNIGGFNYTSGDEYADGINAVALWKTRLTNTQLAQLTAL